MSEDKQPVNTRMSEELKKNRHTQRSDRKYFSQNSDFMFAFSVLILEGNL